MDNNSIPMETGTTYSYLIQSLKNPTLYDIRSISADFMMRLTPEFQKTLKEEIRNKDLRLFRGPRRSFIKKPETEAQMHAYIYENSFAIAKSIGELLSKEDKGLYDFQDVAIVDYDCALGMNTLALIEYYRSLAIEGFIHEIVLIDENSLCLERAELLVHSVAPSVKISTIHKKIEDVTVKDVKLEHLMVYHIMCGSKPFMNSKVFESTCGEGRYLFSKFICHPDIFIHDHTGFAHQFRSTDSSDYSFVEKVDLESVKIYIPKKAKDYYDNFIELFDYIPISHIKDTCAEEVSRFINHRSGWERECTDFFGRLAKTSISAALNYAICLLKGIGSDKDAESAYAKLQSLKMRCDAIDEPNESDDYIKSKILGVMIDCLDEIDGRRDEKKSLMQEYLSLNINEHDKCRIRLNYSILLNEESDTESVKGLLQQCVEHGCWSCHEATNYDLDKRNCPNAQHSLAQLLYYQNNDIEKSIPLIQDAAKQEYPRAIQSLGYRYFNGIGLTKDEGRAKELFLKAASMGNPAGCLCVFNDLKDKDNTRALWYLALAYTSKSGALRAAEILQSFIPKVVFGKSGERLVEDVFIRAAEDGLEQYKKESIRILLRRADDYMAEQSYDDVKAIYKRLESLDAELSTKKLEELENSIPDLDEFNNDVYIEPYSREDSLMDALDDEPSAVWNLD